LNRHYSCVLFTLLATILFTYRQSALLCITTNMTERERGNVQLELGQEIDEVLLSLRPVILHVTQAQRSREHDISHRYREFTHRPTHSNPPTMQTAAQHSAPRLQLLRVAQDCCHSERGRGTNPTTRSNANGEHRGGTEHFAALTQDIQAR